MSLPKTSDQVNNLKKFSDQKDRFDFRILTLASLPTLLFKPDFQVLALELEDQNNDLQIHLALSYLCDPYVEDLRLVLNTLALNKYKNADDTIPPEAYSSFKRVYPNQLKESARVLNYFRSDINSLTKHFIWALKRSANRISNISPEQNLKVINGKINVVKSDQKSLRGRFESIANLASKLNFSLTKLEDADFQFIKNKLNINDWTTDSLKKLTNQFLDGGTYPCEIKDLVNNIRSIINDLISVSTEIDNLFKPSVRSTVFKLFQKIKPNQITILQKLQQEINELIGILKEFVTELSENSYFDDQILAYFDKFNFEKDSFTFKELVEQVLNVA